MQNSNYIKLIRLAPGSLLSSGQVISTPRHEYRITFVKNGRLSLRINDRTFSVSSNSVYFQAPGENIQFLDHSNDFECEQLIFDTDYFLLCLKNQVKLCFYPFFQLNRMPVLKLTKSQWENLLSIKEKIAFEIVNRERINDDLLCRLYLNVLLIEIERINDFNEADNHSPLSRKHFITARFKKSLEKNFLTIRKVSDYAEKLYISPTYLNDTVKEVTGQSASEIIQERLILEIKGELIQTESNINQIAFKLGFNDTSYFCRFFKKNTGVSPQTFRETNHFQGVH